MTKKSLQFKIDFNERLRQAADWWGIKAKVSMLFLDKSNFANGYAITDFATSPFFMKTKLRFSYLQMFGKT